MNIIYTIILFLCIIMVFEPKLGFTEFNTESTIIDFNSNYNNTTNSNLFVVDNECYSKGGIIIYEILGKADLSDINPHSNLLKIKIFKDTRINTESDNNSRDITAKIIIDNDDNKAIEYDISEISTSCNITDFIDK